VFTWLWRQHTLYRSFLVALAGAQRTCRHDLNARIKPCRYRWPPQEPTLWLVGYLEEMGLTSEALQADAGILKRIALVGAAGLQSGFEPVRSLGGRSMREGFGLHLSSGISLQTIVANRRGRL
jgi:hypothetical protein